MKSSFDHLIPFINLTLTNMAGTGANSIPLGALHPILRGQKVPGGGITGPIGMQMSMPMPMPMQQQMPMGPMGGGGGGESAMLNAAREAAARVTANIMGKRPAPPNAGNAAKSMGRLDGGWRSSRRVHDII